MSQELFQMVITDIFYIKGRGVVVDGSIESGHIRKGDKVTLCSSNMKPILTITVDGIPMPSSDKLISSLFFKDKQFHKLVKSEMYLIKSELIEHE